jgi:nucleotidyltransferase/DNA polymerase involved in DNA repair
MNGRSRTIVHLDADAFFAAVEQAADPKLRGKPIAVGGEKRGIIASASYEARKFGVYTPMPTARARKLCPKLIVLPGDFERYEQFSNWMFGYCYDFTPDVEQTSIDEGYFDLSGARKPPLEIALTIRKAIGQKLKITVSEGIGTNKLVSGVASKLNKPAAFREVEPGGEVAFLHPLPNKWLPGIGPKTSARLNAAGLAQICHVAATPLEMLELLLGNQAAGIREYAHGIDERLLIPAVEIHIQVSGHDLVQCVERSPYLLALPQAIKQFKRERAQVAVAVSALALGQLGHNVVRFLPGSLITRCPARNRAASTRVAEPSTSAFSCLESAGDFGARAGDVRRRRPRFGGGGGHPGDRVGDGVEKRWFGQDRPLEGSVRS